MTAFLSYTGSESRMPLIYHFVYDVLSNAVPHTQQAQLVDVIYAFLVDSLLHYSPDLIIYRVHIWAVWGHWLGEMKSGISRCKSAIVSLSLCAFPVGIWNCATWSESERRLLSWSTAEGEAVVMHQRNIGWQFHIQTGQRTCAHSAIDQWCAWLHRHFKFHKVVQQQT